MKRKEFLKTGLSSLGILAVTPIIASCDDTSEKEISTTTNSNGGSSGNCTVTNSETEGPFPIKDPSSLPLSDIRGDRSGVKLIVEITIKSANADCVPLVGALVDIWHCDAKGDYSEYGGTQMQPTNHISEHWLRGRQTTNSTGTVGFTSIFPGWYNGRAPHIHVHVYSSNGKSLLISQIAFSKDICDTVYTISKDYIAHGKQDTTNERDNVFRDGYANELGSLSGSVSTGYTLAHTIVVAA